MTEKNTGAAYRELGMMEGKSFYNRHSRPQRGAVAFGLPLLEHAVEAVPLPDPGEVFQVADYGVAGGNNSMEPMRTVVDGLRRRASDKLPVSIFHTDLPTNDFDPLFTLLASPDSYLRGTSNVFAYAGASLFTSGFSRRTLSTSAGTRSRFTGSAASPPPSPATSGPTGQPAP
jgi:hypothetical protein